MTQIADMRLLLATFASLLAGVPAAMAARPGNETRTPAAVSLRGLDAIEAARLIGALQDAQRRLRAGEQLFFDLLSGAPASYRETERSPRSVFLDIAFDTALIIERRESRNRLRQSYQLVISRAWGETHWTVDVTLGFQGSIERVEMVFRPPAPF